MASTFPISPAAIITSIDDMLAKLRWEIDGLEADSAPDSGRYRFWNCALTSWHAVEIMHKTMPAPQQQALSAAIGFNVTGEGGFGKWQEFLRLNSDGAR